MSGEETVMEQQFSVDDTQPSFRFYQRYIIMSNHATIVRNFIFSAFIFYNNVLRFSVNFEFLYSVFWNSTC